jgi:hypothetical protein
MSPVSATMVEWRLRDSSWLALELKDTGRGDAGATRPEGAGV